MALKEELGKLEQIREERYLEMEKASYRNMLERELRKELEDGIATCGSLL